jgi:hypothetical protein
MRKQIIVLECSYDPKYCDAPNLWNWGDLIGVGSDSEVKIIADGPIIYENEGDKYAG